jgi:allantoate deiminase
VMLGIAVVELLQGKKLRFAIDVIGFSEEEGVRFATPYFGSRAVAGTFDARSLNLTDRHGVVFDQAMRNFGLDPSRIGDAAYDRGKVIGYIEAHIEQGPVLEAADVPLGVVSAIAGQSKYVVSFNGRAGHAGTVPMDRRHDALAAAAQFISSAESIAKSNLQSGKSLVATVGKMSVEPGATNVIPGRVTLTLDVRDADDEVRRAAGAAIFRAGREQASQRGVEIKIEPESHQNATPMAEPFKAILSRQIEECCQITPLSLPSGAGHDAAIMASLCPVAMIFLRNPGGISHHPDESVSADDVAAAEKVLHGFVIALANE